MMDFLLQFTNRKLLFFENAGHYFMVGSFFLFVRVINALNVIFYLCVCDKIILLVMVYEWLEHVKELNDALCS